jgi:hypothetical protein
MFAEPVVVAEPLPQRRVYVAGAFIAAVAPDELQGLSPFHAGMPPGSAGDIVQVIAAAIPATVQLRVALLPFCTRRLEGLKVTEVGGGTALTTTGALLIRAPKLTAKA